MLDFRYAHTRREVCVRVWVGSYKTGLLHAILKHSFVIVFFKTKTKNLCRTFYHVKFLIQMSINLVRKEQCDASLVVAAKV